MLESEASGSFGKPLARKVKNRQIIVIEQLAEFYSLKPVTRHVTRNSTREVPTGTKRPN